MMLNFVYVKTPIVDIWKIHPERRTYHRVVFNAFPADYENERDRPLPNDLNRYNPNCVMSLQECRKYYLAGYDTEFLEYFVQYVLCSGNYEEYDFVTKLLLTKLVMPWCKIPFILTFVNKEGTGKSLFLNAFCRMFGPYFVVTSSVADITGKFNHLIYGRLIVYGNEAERSNKKSADSNAKSLVTEDYHRHEMKGHDTEMARNQLLWIADSNKLIPHGAELGSRRLVTIEGGVHLINNKQFYNELAYQLKENERSRKFFGAWMYKQFRRINGFHGIDEFNCGHDYNFTSASTLAHKLLAGHAVDALVLKWLQRGYHCHPNMTKWRVSHHDDKQMCFDKEMRTADGKVKPTDTWKHAAPHISNLDGQWLKRVCDDDLYDAYLNEEGLIQRERISKADFFGILKGLLRFETESRKRCRVHVPLDHGDVNEILERPVGKESRKTVLLMHTLEQQRTNFSQLFPRLPPFPDITTMDRDEDSNTESDTDTEGSGSGTIALPRVSVHPDIAGLIPRTRRRIPKPPMIRPKQDGSGFENVFKDNRRGWSIHPFDPEDLQHDYLINKGKREEAEKLIRLMRHEDDSDEDQQIDLNNNNNNNRKSGSSKSVRIMEPQKQKPESSKAKRKEPKGTALDRSLERQKTQIGALGADSGSNSKGKQKKLTDLIRKANEEDEELEELRKREVLEQQAQNDAWIEEEHARMNADDAADLQDRRQARYVSPDPSSEDEDEDDDEPTNYFIDDQAKEKNTPSSSDDDADDEDGS